MSDPTFDLDAALEAWRRFAASSEHLRPGDLAELEAHLRDELAELLAAGLGTEAAFREAQRRLGDYATIDDAYRRTYWLRARDERRLSLEITYRLSMLKNYFKVALRNLLRHPGFTFINASGLAVGIGCCLLMGLYLWHELSYDRFFDGGDDVVRVTDDLRLPSGTTPASNASAFAGPLLTDALPEVEANVRLAQARGYFVTNGEDTFEESRFFYADSTLFDVLPFDVVRGDSRTALAAPFSLVLTEQTARKYFGDADPLGRTLVFDGEDTFTVTGVVADLPSTSHLQFDGLLSMSTAVQQQTFYFQDLIDLRYATYLRLRPRTDVHVLEAKVAELINDRYSDVMRENDFGYTFHLIPLADVYLDAPANGIGAHGSRSNLVTFGAIALFTLIIACINFVNLTTAQSLGRAKEVGVRKVIGARRKQLAVQFLCEAGILGAVGLLGALLLTWVALPFFNALAQTSLSMAALARPAAVGALVASLVVIGLLAGAYPAFALSSFRPVQVLKGRFGRSRRGRLLRQTLVVLQFAISTALIIGTMVAYAQLRYMQTQDLGFNTDHLLVVDFKNDKQVHRQLDLLEDELGRVPGVTDVSASDVVPGRARYRALVTLQDSDNEMRDKMMATFPADFKFADIYGLDVVAGRKLSEDFASDSAGAYLINQTAARLYGYASPQQAIGAKIHQWGKNGLVVGVVRDFHFEGLQEDIGPMTLFYDEDLARYLTVHVSSTDLTQTIAGLQARWHDLVPQRPFDFQFVDDAFNQQYSSETRLGKIVGSFALLAILVACLGLFGLAAFTTQQRMKEIGVRKVMGASVGGIVGLLSREFARLVVVGFVVAAPVAYFVMDGWLASFAYRITLGPGLFALAGLLAVGVSLITISYQTLRAATADPVKSLRYE